MAGLIERARKLKKTIVFPEGGDPRVLEAAARLAREGVVKPVLIGPKPGQRAGGRGLRRSGRSPAAREVRRALLRAPPRQGHHPGGSRAKWPASRSISPSLMVGAGDADGSVGGAVNSTAETVRAALHCVGPHPRARLVSSVFIMALQDRSMGHNGLMAFADCAVVIDPTAVATGRYRHRHRREHPRPDRHRTGRGAAQLFHQGQRQAPAKWTRWWRRCGSCGRARPI